MLIIDPLTIVLSSMVYNDGDELISNIANISNIFGKDIISLSVLCCHFLRKANSISCGQFLFGSALGVSRPKILPAVDIPHTRL